MEDLENNKATFLYYIKLSASFQSHWWIQTGVKVRKRSIRVKIGDVFVPCDLEIWRMTLKNNRSPLLCCFKLCASFHSHQSIQPGVTVRKCPIWIKISDFFVQCDLEIWQKTLKNNRAPFLCYFNLFASFHSLWWIQTRVKVSRFSVPCDLEIWQMTLISNRASLLCCFKLCASFHSHKSIQTGVTVRKCPIWVKINEFFVPCDLEVWRMTLKNNRAPKQYQALCIISSSFVNSKWSYGLETAKLVFDLCDLDLWPLTFCMDKIGHYTSVIGNNSWKFHDDTMTGTLWRV